MQPAPRAREDHSQEHPVELITGALHDARELAVAEVDKLKAEAITQVKSVGEEIKIAAIGLLILTVAAIMLGITLGAGLTAAGLPAWAAFGIVTVVFAVAGTTFLHKRRAIAKAT